MQKIKIWGDDPSEKQLSVIVKEIEGGGMVIVPTDSVYAIICDALNPKAIDRLCNLKRLNPEKNTLSMICSDISMASEYANFDNSGFQLLKQYTPGPFTFIFRASRNLPKAIKGRKEVGVRIPDNRTTLRIVEQLGHPVLTASIEFEDEDHARDCGLIGERYEKEVDLLVEGEEGGTEYTTIVDARESEPEILRQGKGEL